MKKMNQKILSLLTAGVMLASSAFGVTSNAAENTVKFGTPVLDGVKDGAYESSYTVSMKDLYKQGLLSDMNKFQFMSREFDEIYFDEDDDELASGYIKIYTAGGTEITHDTFYEEYDLDYGALPSDVLFRWTDAGVESEYFVNATFSFLWDEGSIYVYVDVTDNNNLVMTESELAEEFSSPWGGSPWLIDGITAKFAIEGVPYTSYKWEKIDGEYQNYLVVDEDTSLDNLEFSAVAVSNAIAYYSNSYEYTYYDTETLSVAEKPMTLLNNFHINWWERGAYVDGEGPGRYFRELVCDGSDTTYNEETGAASTCADSHDNFVSRHVFTAEKIAERDAGRAENLDYIAGGLNENGYSLEMSIPLTGRTWSLIRDNGYKLLFNPQVVDGDKMMLGNSISGGAAAKWYFLTAKEDIELTFETPECDGTHKYHDGIVTVEPTCVEGEMTYICALCDATTTEAIAPAYDHTVVDAPATEATCTEPAYTAGTVCSECGTYLSGHEAEGEALGHNVVDAPATEATCTEPAYTAGTMCDRCGEYLSGHEAEGEALGHTDEDKDTVCDVCGENARTAGDVNYDGKIDTKDLTRLMKAIAGQDVEIFGSDVNGDGETDTKDLTRLMKALAGEEVELH